LYPIKAGVGELRYGSGIEGLNASTKKNLRKVHFTHFFPTAVRSVVERALKHKQRAFDWYPGTPQADLVWTPQPNRTQSEFTPYQLKKGLNDVLHSKQYRITDEMMRLSPDRSKCFIDEPKGNFVVTFADIGLGNPSLACSGRCNASDHTICAHIAASCRFSRQPLQTLLHPMKTSAGWYRQYKHVDASAQISLVDLDGFADDTIFMPPAFGRKAGRPGKGDRKKPGFLQRLQGIKRRQSTCLLCRATDHKSSNCPMRGQHRQGTAGLSQAPSG